MKNKQRQDLENRLRELEKERDEKLLAMHKEYQKINSRIGEVKAKLRRCNESE